VQPKIGEYQTDYPLVSWAMTSSGYNFITITL
jgi:hypothetical protein